MKNIILFALFIFFTSLPISAATYYIDTNGNDANSGTTEAAAWKTLQKVNAAAIAPGDAILFKRGQTFNGSVIVKSAGTSANPIRYGAYGSGAKPIINGFTKWNPTWTQTGTNIWRANQRVMLLRLNNQKPVFQKSVEMLTKPYDWYRNESVNDGVTYIYSPTNPNTYYNNNFDIGSGNAVFDIDNKAFIIVENLEIWGGNYYTLILDMGGNSILRDLTIKYSHAYGIYVVNSTNNIVERNDVSIGNRYGIAVQEITDTSNVQNNIIRNNTVTGFSGTGILVQGKGGNYRAKNNQVLNNTSYGNGDGLYIRYADGTTAKGNNFYGNIRNEWVGGEGYGIGVQSGSNNVLENNNLYDNRRSGIEIWGGVPTTANPGYGPSNGNKVLRNRIYRSGLEGILISSTGQVDNTIIAYNAIYNNTGMAITIGDRGNTGIQLLNNTVYGHARNSLFNYVEAQPTIKNNLFASGGSVTIYNSPLISNNGFAGAPLRWEGSTVADNLITSKNNTFVVGTADFVNAAAGDFSLKAGSPFINKGTNVGYTTDIRGSSFSGVADIGAFEYGGSIQPTGTQPTSIPSITLVPTVTMIPTVTIRPTATTGPTARPSGAACVLKAKGDADCNGALNTLDIRVVMTAINSNTFNAAADFNKDNKSDTTDLVLLLNNYLKL